MAQGRPPWSELGVVSSLSGILSFVGLEWYTILSILLAAWVLWQIYLKNFTKLRFGSMLKMEDWHCAIMQCGFFFKVTKGELPPIPPHLNSETKDFIRRCLRVKPEERPSARELLEHPFVAHALPTFAAAASASGLRADLLL
jgi:serine/threonine protein kinase